ncbi:MAG TPA: LysM peptidoglycan-binding domain-containing protein [Chitinophaga sp.]|uniref:LysM peptidoglycan-binding domain-containing protein n=1 Tax=Chitinophaga sp. TaxID=1869181 RepID=UPI002CD97124|nr:LysM peptidoglycan-binding domain-containing protein [Chitinophaga sp.]HVI47966.1 LysM peptidoglycan-binding domain-containing protein [Chitinophaga sp.]
MPFPEFKLLGEETNKQSQKTIKEYLDKFGTFISSQKVIRAIVQNGPGYGHQSSTVNLIRRLAGPVTNYPRGFAYKGTIEVYGDMNSDGGSLRTKLLELMPELNGKDKGQINEATIELKDSEKDKPEGYVLFGFSGGYDFPNFLQGEGRFEGELEDHKITTFLLMQPYRWLLNPTFGRTEAQVPGNLVFYEADASVSPKVYRLFNLDKFEFAKTFHIAYRGFSMPLQDLSPETWEEIKSLTKPPITGLVEMIQYLTQDAIVSRYDLVPIYGIKTPGDIQFKKPVSHRLALEMAIYYNALKDGARIKPPIIINFSQYDPLGDATLSLDTVQQLAEGEYTLDEMIAASQLGTRLSEIKKAQLEKKITIAKNRKIAFGNTIGQGLIRVVNYLTLDNKEKVDEQLAWLAEKKNRVLLIQADRVPPLVFNYAIKRAGLPPLFEGNNTAIVTINAGKPYFHTNSPGGKVNQYPVGKVGTIDYTKLIGSIQKVASHIQDDFSAWPAAIKKSATSITAAFLKLTYPDEPVFFEYFGSIMEFFGNEFNDKFNVASALTTMMMESKWFTEASANLAASPSLSQLYDNILAEIEKSGSVDLLGTILPSGGIHDYLKSTVAISGGKIIVTTPTVTAEKDKDQKIVKVLLTGKTNAFGIATLCTFSFTIVQDAYACSADFQGATSWSLDNVPWIVFDQPTFSSISSDAGLPPSGAINARLHGTDLKLSVAFPDVAGIAVGTASFDKPQSLSLFSNFVGGISLEQYLPAPLAKLANIGVTSVAFGYNMERKALDRIVVVITSPDSWSILPRLVLKDLNLEITVTSPGDLETRTTTAALSGNLLIGADDKAPTVKVLVTLPDLYITGQLTSDELPLNTLLSVFWSNVNLPWPGGKEPAITAFTIGYGYTSRDYQLDVNLALQWPITLAGTTILTIEYISLYLMGGPGLQTGGLSGSLTVLPDSEKIGLKLIANYLGENTGWRFSAIQTSGQVSLVKLLTFYLPAGWAPDTSQFDILINGLGIIVETATNSWEFTGKTATPISIPGIGVDIDLNLKAGYNGGTLGLGRDSLTDSTPIPYTSEGRDLLSAQIVTPEKGYFGTLSAKITWENISLTVFYDFNPTYQAYGIRWGILEGKIVENKNGDQIATLSFTKSTTIGSMVETMISWATGSSFNLSSPWNILNSIPLNNLSLEYNFTKKQVGFNVNIGPIEMGFARIDGIRITYKSNQPDPADNGVQIELNGSFRWQDDPNKPLAWDAARPETTPAPDGQGNKYLNLRLLALGQHVTLPCFATANNVQEAIACMKQLPKPDKDNITIPPVTLDPNSSWITGMEFGVLRFGDEKKPAKNNVIDLATAQAATTGYLLTMQIIFNDPTLYALRLKLDGPAAKVFKGLDFQIMYKKISDEIGMYKAEITLPDRMRFIRAGQFNITLPSFGIEYYTNGDFQVDIGFPWKADFARSFTFQTLIWTPIGIPIPVMGSVGIYFGKLSSATTNRVPKIDNGTFNPVLVFGFGVQFGIGYTFDVGILKAGFSLTAVAIIEGILAKFNPYQLTDGSGNTNQLESSYYFWLKGTAGIIGKLFGTIDFAIIKAEVNVDVRILASFTFAPYEDIELSLTASVSVSVSVSINLGLFKIRISFSFSAKISQAVRIKGIGGTPPWHVIPGPAAFNITQRRIRRRGLAAASRLLSDIAAPQLKWNNLVNPGNPQPLNAYLGLGLTMAGDNAATLSQQVACYVAMMFIESVAGPQEDSTSCVLKAASTAADSSFEMLVKMALRWAVAALQPSGNLSPAQVDEIVVTSIDLQYLLTVLQHPEQGNVFSEGDIDNFLGSQFSLQVEGPTTQKEMNATYFPVAPALELALPKYGSNYKDISYSFREYNKTSSDYQAFLREYFDQLAVHAQKENNKGLKAFALADENGPSLGSFIFNDYFLLICRQMIQTAIDSLQEFKYFIPNNETSVQNILDWINSNAGLTGPDAYNVEELFADNASAALNAGIDLKIHGATYVVQAKDTFDTIAKNSLFGGSFSGATVATLNADTDNTLTPGITISYPDKPPYNTQPGQSLAAVAQALNVSVADLISKGGVTTLANLPLPVATLALPDFTCKTAAGDTLRSIAAKYRITLTTLAIPNSSAKNLFNRSETPSLDIAGLTQFKVGELLREIQATQGLQHLSGMTSRYYMAGLRLPTQGIAPKKKGMWVTGNDPKDFKLPDFAGLYALTGQQFAIPDLNDTDTFNVNFENKGIKWLSFVNTDKNKLTIAIAPKSDDAKQIKLVKDYATTTKLDTGLSFLGMNGMFNTKEATYAFNTPIEWNAASAFSMPYGGMPPGVPALQCWQIPDPLLALPDLSVRKVNPRIAMKTGEYNEALRTMVKHPLNYYGYASLVGFTIKKVPVNTASPSTLTLYEITGADGSSAKILERIVSQIGNDNNAIQSLIPAYGADANSTTSEGIQTDDINALTVGIAQVNLSTDTHPDVAAAARFAAVGDQMTLLNSKTDFIRLLWEASITRSGGYFLYYFNKDNGAGLPDRIFNDKGEADISLIVMYAQPADTNIRNTVCSYMNALVTGETVDPQNAQLFAEADPLKDFSIPSSRTQTLSELAYQYFGNVSDVARDNQKLRLRKGLRIKAAEGAYEVGPNAPGGDLPAIATYFNTTQQAIKDANPQITSWPQPLPLFTAIFLPVLEVEPGNNLNTLGDIAKYYGINLTSLANYNKDIAGIFDDGQSVKISGGPVITTSTLPQGNMAMEAVRPKPPVIPDTPGADYGKIFLLNMYSLLSYQIYQNAFFSQSPIGLPVGPTAEPDDPENWSKVRAPKTLAPGEDWRFNVTMPYSQYSLQTPKAAGNNLPDPGKSPYKGIGDIFQVNFAWQDLYGNQLITDLKSPAAGGNSPLNMPPVLTGYTDPIIGLNQWPSVASTYKVVKDNTKPALVISLTFDNSPYQGLISAAAPDAQTVSAVFTEPLDRTSAELIINYQLNDNIVVTAATLLADNVTVKLAVSNIPDEKELLLDISNISNAAKTQVFQGQAKFYHSQRPNVSTSSLITKAQGDLITYTQLWYQLTDTYGIGYTVETSLVAEKYQLSNAQVNSLVREWLASVWQFINDRAQGKTTVATPSPTHDLSFVIDTAKLNNQEIFRLNTGFTIERTGGAVIGDLETTGGIKQAGTAISPFSGVAGALASGLDEFAFRLEEALLDAGKYELKVATGSDRDESLSSGKGNELWVVRLGLNKETSISYAINEKTAPLIFAPAPISTQLINRSQVPIWDFNPAKGIDFNTNPNRYLDFSGIDMDMWGQTFFGNIDNTLSAEYVAAIQLVDNHQKTTYLQTMLDNKQALADIVKAWMTFVFEGESGSVAEMQEAFRQQLLAKLSNAYAVKAGVQYAATVNAGDFKLVYINQDQHNNNSITLLFTSDINSTTAQNISNYSISGGLTILSAASDQQNPQRVTIQLNGTPVINETIVTVNKDFTSASGQGIKGALAMKVEGGDAATPQLYGNIARNFSFLGAALDSNNHAQLFLYFSDEPDKNIVTDRSRYQVSGLTVDDALPYPENPHIVKLVLSGEAIDGETKVNIVPPFLSSTGQKLTPPTEKTVSTNVDVSHYAQEINITTAKLNLKNSSNVPLPFLLSSPQLVKSDTGAILSYIDLDTSYDVTAIEHQINILPQVADYHASSWLGFIQPAPVLKASLGTVKVPVILRAFPASPSMVKQDGEYPGVAQPDDISRILDWDYIIRYNQAVHYPQDTLFFTVNFNVFDNNALKAASFKDAFNALAEFIVVYPDVEKALNEYLIRIDATTTSDETFRSASVALGSFNAMVSRIIDSAEGNALKMTGFIPASYSNNAEPYHFRVKEGSGSLGADTGILVITILGAPPEGIDNPVVEIPGYTTRTYGDPLPGVFSFYFTGKDDKPLKAEEGQNIGARTVRLTKMNILARQDVETTVELKRNDDLIPEKITAPGFIYTTGHVGFPNIFHPLISYDKLVNIATLSGQGPQSATLDAHLTQLFDMLLKENTQDKLSFLMSNTYSYKSNTELPGLDNIQLPVIMQPMQLFNVKSSATEDGDTTLKQMISNWSNSILLWFGSHKPSQLEGVLQFDLTIFSNLTKQPMPLIRLTTLVLDIKYITDIPS